MSGLTEKRVKQLFFFLPPLDLCRSVSSGGSSMPPILSRLKHPHTHVQNSGRNFIFSAATESAKPHSCRADSRKMVQEKNPPSGTNLYVYTQ